MSVLLEDSVVDRTEFSNPFYVIVHAQGARLAPLSNEHIDVPRFCKVHYDLEFIRTFEDYVELGDKTPPDIILPGIPRDRPVLVCGFLGNICVQEQMRTLRNHGYHAYIDSRATYF